MNSFIASGPLTLWCMDPSRNSARHPSVNISDGNALIELGAKFLPTNAVGRDRPAQAILKLLCGGEADRGRLWGPQRSALSGTSFRRVYSPLLPNATSAYGCTNQLPVIRAAVGIAAIVGCRIRGIGPPAYPCMAQKMTLQTTKIRISLAGGYVQTTSRGRMRDFWSTSSVTANCKSTFPASDLSRRILARRANS